MLSKSPRPAGSRLTWPSFGRQRALQCITCPQPPGRLRVTSVPSLRLHRGSPWLLRVSGFKNASEPLRCFAESYCRLSKDLRCKLHFILYGFDFVFTVCSVQLFWKLAG